MTNLWTGKTVAFNPLFIRDELVGFSIVSRTNKVMYGKEANYNSLLSEAKQVICYDSFELENLLQNWKFFKHNFKTLYFQVKPEIRFQNLSDIVKQEFYSEDTSDYSFLTRQIDGMKRCITEASFMLNFYLQNYKVVNKNILKIDNELLDIAHRSHLIQVDELSIRTTLSEYLLKQWEIERQIFKIVGHPIISASQLSFELRKDESLLKKFELKNKYKTKYESLVRYLDIEELDIDFDITGTSTCRILCRDLNEGSGLFAPDNEYKQNFCAPSNFIFVSADYSKQEATILAEVANDERLKRDLVHDDYYAKLAKLLVGTRDKQTGKTLFYSLLYGVSIKNLAIDLNIDEEEAFDIKRALEKRYSSSIKWLKQAKNLKTNYFGRKLYTNTANAYIQSTAADIVRLKLLETKNFNPTLVFSDNIIYTIPENKKEQAISTLTTILEDVKPFNLRVLVKYSNNLKF